MKIHSAVFMKSCIISKDYPPDIMPEVAFAGRSNVGKSSIINALCRPFKIAKTSQTPGKTRMLNFYLINEAFRFVDLPGYGYAHVDLSTRASWQKMVESYLSAGRRLKSVALLIDSRRWFQEEEYRLIEYLEEFRIPVDLAFTKIDKLNRSETVSLKRRLDQETDLEADGYFFLSSTRNLGIAEFGKRLTSRLSE
jgi:GTP-binding protein